jgi:putative component of membrane protein insertase Oxa1/YidC/SpoIIIJ protein YidD
MPGGDDEIAEEERRQRREQAVDAGDTGTEAAGSVGWCDGCDAPDCDLPGCDVPDCDCGGCDLLRVSTLLALVAAVVPARAPGVALLIRGYRRWLTRFTPACPSEPSCSAYALRAVQTLGARRGLSAAARRVRGCGRPASGPR